MLVCYKWERNIRQLRNYVLKAVILCDDDYLDLEHFPDIANDNKDLKLSNSDYNRFIDLFTKDGNHKTLLQIQREIIQRFQEDFRYKPEEIKKYLNIKAKK